MIRVELLLAFVDIAFLIFAFVDVLITEGWRVRAVPKLVWLLAVVLLAPFGGILWFLLGKESTNGRNGPRMRQVHPDDDPEFFASMRARDEQDERIRLLEEELAALDDDKSPDAPGSQGPGSQGPGFKRPGSRGPGSQGPGTGGSNTDSPGKDTPPGNDATGT